MLSQELRVVFLLLAAFWLRTVADGIAIASGYLPQPSVEIVSFSVKHSRHDLSKQFMIACSLVFFVVSSVLPPASSLHVATPPLFDFINGTNRLRFASDDSLVLLHNYGLHVLLGGR
ncbi:unnamed protein product [Heligmosomoides polygyrus]|uniref:Secreted protein n=1 Tax=Heligmosomoides polygyrus TaxID=6339 RepID=A0A183G0P0_HELPZ|nr:unnamed protein product [Heligmosomoides polygyrus]